MQTAQHIQVESPTLSLPRRTYPGLRPFEPVEDAIFFGREAMVDEIIDLLASRSLILVHGSSGSGKSSLIKAGLLPRLARQHRRHGWQWKTAYMRPGGGPLWNLARALAEFDEKDPALERINSLRLRFDQPGVTLTEIIAHSAELEGRRLCLLVDQFEELFRYARETSREESRLFVDLITAVLEKGDASPLRIIITMRSEFLGECARIPGLASVVNTAQYLLPPMQRDALQRAIRRPAELYRGEVTIELADRLVTEVSGAQDELPLIQHGLMRLWELVAEAAHEVPAHPRLDIPLYEKHGPLARLLDRHAEAVASAAAVPESDRSYVEKLFCALTDINADGQAIRRPQSFNSLVAVTGATPERLRSILVEFLSDKASFVTRYASPGADDDPIIDVSHEALIRCWRSLADSPNGWLLHEFRDGLAWRSLLSQTELFEKDPNNVLGPAATIDRTRWMAERTPAWSMRYGGGWSRVEHLLTASRKAAERQRRRERWFTWALGIAAAGLLLAMLSAGILWLQAREQLARANQALASGIWSDLLSVDRTVLTPHERNALWSLAETDPVIRSLFIKRLQSDLETPIRFGTHPEMISRALGLNWPSSAQVLPILNNTVKAIEKARESEQFANLGRSMQALTSKLTSQQAQQALAPYLEKIADETEYGRVGALAPAVRASTPTFSKAQAARILPVLLEAIRGTSDNTDLGGLQYLTQAAEGLARLLSEREAQEAIESLLVVVSKTTDGDALDALSKVGEILTGRLSVGQTERGLKAVLNIIPAAMDDTDQRKALIQIAQGLVDKLDESQAQAALTTVLLEMSPTKDVIALRYFADIAGVLPGKVVEVQAQQTIDILLEQYPRTGSNLTTYVATLTALSGKLDGAQAQTAMSRLFDHILKTSGTSLRLSATLNRLALAFESLSERLTDVQAWQAFTAALSAIGKTSDSDQLNALSGVAPALAKNMSKGEVDSAFDQLLDVLPKTTTAGGVICLAKATRAFSGKLSQAKSQQALTTILERISLTTNYAVLRMLGEAASALSGRPTGTSVEQALHYLLEQISRAPLGQTPEEVKSFAIRNLAQAIGGLAGKLTVEETHQALVALIKAAPTVDEDGFDDVANGMKALAAHLPEEQTQQALTTVLNTIPSASDAEPPSGLADLVRAFGDKLSDAQVNKVFPWLLKAVPKSPDEAHAKAIGSLAERLTEAEAQQALLTILEVMVKTTRRSTLKVLTKTVETVTRRLANGHTEEALGFVLNGVSKVTDSDQLKALAQAAQAFIGKLTDGQSERALAPVKSALGWSASADEAAIWARTVGLLLARRSEVEKIREFAEILKYPIVAGPATDVLLQAMQDELPGAPGKGTELAANLEWIATRDKTIDWATPATCPRPLEPNPANLTCPAPATPNLN